MHNIWQRLCKYMCVCECLHRRVCMCVCGRDGAQIRLTSRPPRKQCLERDWSKWIEQTVAGKHCLIDAIGTWLGGSQHVEPPPNPHGLEVIRIQLPPAPLLGTHSCFDIRWSFESAAAQDGERHKKWHPNLNTRVGQGKQLGAPHFPTPPRPCFGWI